MYVDLDLIALPGASVAGRRRPASPLLLSREAGRAVYDRGATCPEPRSTDHRWPTGAPSSPSSPSSPSFFFFFQHAGDTTVRCACGGMQLWAGVFYEAVAEEPAGWVQLRLPPAHPHLPGIRVDGWVERSGEGGVRWLRAPSQHREKRAQQLTVAAGLRMFFFMVRSRPPACPSGPHPPAVAAAAAAAGFEPCAIRTFAPGCHRLTVPPPRRSSGTQRPVTSCCWR